jgi:hypothetical protein
LSETSTISTVQDVSSCPNADSVKKLFANIMKRETATII